MAPPNQQTLTGKLDSTYEATAHQHEQGGHHRSRGEASGGGPGRPLGLSVTPTLTQGETALPSGSQVWGTGGTMQLMHS